MDENTNNKIKLYVAIAMRGKSRDDILSDLRLVATELDYNPDDVEFVNLLPENVATEHTPIECLGMSIMNLSRADRVIIAKPGAGVSCEEYICNKYHIPYTKVGFGDWE